MKTEFNILWVDDNKEFVQSLKQPLTKWMDDQGFTLKVIEHADENGVLADLTKTDVELLVFDYKLPGKDGDSLIEEVRANQHYHDVVFYSEGDLPSKSLDGVFFVSREHARERIKEVINFKILRAMDLCTVRGWVVADAIELEQRLGKLLPRWFVGSEQLFAERVLHHDGLFDFGKKQAVLNGILKDHIAGLEKSGEKAKKADFEKCKTVLSQFDQEIVQVRNMLAHQHVEIDDKGKRRLRSKAGSKKGDLVEISPEQCTKFRKDIRKHSMNLDSLEKLLAQDERGVTPMKK